MGDARPSRAVFYANVNIQNRLVIDEKHDQYLIVSEVWQNNRRYHSVVIHVKIINSKISIQSDNTEEGIAQDWLSSGIPTEEIVLGFQEPQVLFYTGFAIA